MQFGSGLSLYDLALRVIIYCVKARVNFVFYIYFFFSQVES
jgi:hypothetical protein